MRGRRRRLSLRVPLPHSYALALSLLAIAGPLLWIFGPAFIDGQSFAFRDAAHYYRPLFQWTRAQWAGGQVPLWNPQDNCGTPVVANSTSSVFYPGQLLFALPVDYAVLYKLYVVLHVVLAASAAYWLTRVVLGTSAIAAALAGLVYALNGHVLFQHCNVVYLVGAAWLPVALLATHRSLAERSSRWAMVLAVVLALMVLGGDPQMGYNAGLLAALYALILWLCERKERADIEGAAVQKRFRWPARPLLLLQAALTAFVLSAVAVLPATQWTRLSHRALFELPRSLYEVPEYLERGRAVDRDDVRSGRPNDWSGVAQGVFGVPARQYHAEHIYDFSIGPWRLLECLWPNVSGQLLPRHQRWIRILPAESRTWSPSLYFGLLPLLLSLIALGWRKQENTVRWLSCCTLLAAVASLGWYGPGWLLHMIQAARGAEAGRPTMGQPVGGLYWLMVVVLPGYAYFRYPAKLWTIVALGLSVLAARGLDRVVEQPGRRLPWTLAGMGIASLVLWIAFLALRPVVYQSWSSVPPDSLFGPFQPRGAADDVSSALLHTAVVSLALWLVLLVLTKSTRYRPACAASLLLITAVELAIAQRSLVPLVPDHLWKTPSAAVQQIAAHDAAAQGTGAPAYRAFRGTYHGWLPPSWRRTSSDTRLQQAITWDRDTLFPKHHLDQGNAVRIDLVESYSALRLADLYLWLRVARLHGPARPDGIREPHPAALAALSARYLILPAGLEYPDTTDLDWEAGPGPDAELWHHPGHLPRAWIVRDVEMMPPAVDRSPQRLQQRLERILFPADGRPRNFRQSAVVTVSGLEQERQLLALTDLTDAAAEPLSADESCLVAEADAQRVELQVRLAAPALVVLNDLHYPGWIAERQTNGQRVPLVVLQTNQVMRGVYLPAGEHRVVYRYRPPRFYVGALLSVMGWLAVAAVGTRQALRVVPIPKGS